MTLLSGQPPDIHCALQSIRQQLTDSTVLDYPIQVYTPFWMQATSNPYKFAHSQLCLVTNTTLPFPVCTIVSVGCVDGFLCSNWDTEMEWSEQSWPRLFLFLTHSLFSSQLPRAVNRSKSSYCHILPVEVAGILMWQAGVKDGDWVIVCSSDDMGTFTAQLAVRGQADVNIVAGQIDLKNTGPGMESLRGRIEDEVVPAVIEANSLPPLYWTQSGTPPHTRPSSPSHLTVQGHAEEWGMGEQSWPRLYMQSLTMQCIPSPLPPILPE